MNKYNRLLYASIFFSLFSCKEEDDISDLSKKIIGTWELETTICGECTTPYVTFPPGQGEVIVLAPDGSFERRNQDTVSCKGTYSLLKNKECNKSTGDIAFYTSEWSKTAPLFVTLEDDKLRLSTPYCYADGGIRIYAKRK